MDGDGGLFRHQKTRQPLPKKVQMATVEEVDCRIILKHTSNEGNGIVESEALDS